MSLLFPFSIHPAYRSISPFTLISLSISSNLRAVIFRSYYIVIDIDILYTPLSFLSFFFFLLLLFIIILYRSLKSFGYRLKSGIKRGEGFSLYTILLVQYIYNTLLSRAPLRFPTFFFPSPLFFFFLLHVI